MENPKISLRKANKTDIKFIFNTYNNGVKNLKFINDRLINFETHKNWFKDNLNKKETLIYIAIKKPELSKIGYVRFQRVKFKTWEISIANTPGFQGKGYGTIFLEKSINKFKNKTRFIAIVKKNNKSSLKCFLKNSFKIKQKKNYLLNKNISSFKFSYLELIK